MYLNYILHEKLSYVQNWSMSLNAQFKDYAYEHF